MEKVIGINAVREILESDKNIEKIEVYKGLGKDKDGHGYKYVTGSKILDYVKPLMINYGILLKQEILSIENVLIDSTTFQASLSPNNCPTK